MLKAIEQPLTFYPAYCFSASPTFNAWVKLTAAGVHALRSRRGFEGQGVYFYLNHPIQWVQVAGLVVDFEPNDQYWLFHVDDGSGVLIEVVLPRKKAEKVPLAKSREQITFVSQRSLGVSILGNEIDLSSIEIGVTVKVKGGIREFRSVKQIALERLFYLKDTSAEMQAWETSVRQYREIISQPWQVSAAEEKALKKREQRKAQGRKNSRARRAESKATGSTRPAPESKARGPSRAKRKPSTTVNS